MPRAHSPLPTFPLPAPLHRHLSQSLFLLLAFAFPTHSANMSATPSHIIEHVVLFKVKDNTDPTKVNAMIDSLNSLTSLRLMLCRTLGPVHRTKSSSTPFTLMGHSRFSSKENLDAWSAHPAHLSVVREQILPICEELIVADWVVEDLKGPLAPPPGSVMRVSLLKLKEGLGAEVKDEILGVITGIKEKFGGFDEINCGENINSARGKGYSIASLAVFGGVSEMQDVDSSEELVNYEKEKLRDYIEDAIVVDYVVPMPPALQS